MSFLKFLMEWKAQIAPTIPFERRFAAILRRLFARQEKEVLSKVRTSSLFSLNTVTKAKDQFELYLDKVSLDEPRWNKQFTKSTLPLYRNMVKKSGDKVISDLKLGISFDMGRKEVEKFVQTKAMTFSGFVNGETNAGLARIIRPIIKRGGTINEVREEIQNGVKKRFDSSVRGTYPRARMIARTEMVGAANGGSLESAKQTKIVKFKAWLTSRDLTKVRLTHQTAGRRYPRTKGIPLDKKFRVGTALLSAPGVAVGGSNRAREVINCRCVLIFTSKGVGKPSITPSVPEESMPSEFLRDDSASFLTRVGWARTDSKTTLIKQLKKLNIDSVQFKNYGDSLGKFEALIHGNAIGSDLSRMYKDFPALRKILKDKNDAALGRLVLFNKKRLDDGNMGSYGFGKGLEIRELRLAGRSGTVKEHTLHLGSKHYNVGDDLMSTTRHEFGHHFQTHSRYEEVRGVGQDTIFQKDWEKLTKSLPKEKWKRVSGYAADGLDEEELFAESFSAFTSPLYKKGMLPREIESFMETYVGKPVKPKVIPKPTPIPSPALDRPFGVPTSPNPFSTVPAWSSSNNISAIKLQFQNNFNVRNFNLIDFDNLTPSNKALLAHKLNAIGREYTQLFNTNPVLRKVIFNNKEKFSVAFRNGKSVSPRVNWYGVYSPSNRGLTVAMRRKDVIADLKVGDGLNFTAESSIIGVARHELGHHVHSALNVGDRATWDGLYNVGKNTKGWWRNNVSIYSERDIGEAFAESFSAFTSSQYKKGMLPEKVENFMEKVLAGKVSKPIPVVPSKPIPVVPIRPKIFDFENSKLDLKKTKDLAKFKNEFKKAFNVEQVTLRRMTEEFFNDDNTKNLLGLAGEYRRVLQDFPNLQKLNARRDAVMPRFTFAGQEVFLDRSLAFHVSVSSRAQGITIGAKGKITIAMARKELKDTLSVGKKDFTVGFRDDVKSNFRHELGHHIHGIVQLDKNIRLDWEKLARSKSKVAWRREISTYAGQDAEELFAESFGAFTSPLYKQGMLPKEIESFMETYVGKPVKPKVIFKPKPKPKPEPKPTLLNAKIDSVEDLIESGANKAFFVKFKDGTKGIFKPKSGEQDSLRWILTDKGDDGVLYTREVMAFNLDDQFLKWNIVPETVERTVNGKIGSLQKWVAEKNVTVANDVNRISVLDTFRKTQDAEKMYLFDVLIGNADRHSGNYLINNSTFKGFAIDNGISFRETTTLVNPVWFKLRPDIPRSLNVPKVTEKLLDDIKKLDVTAIEKSIEKTINKRAAEQFTKRLNIVKSVIGSDDFKKDKTYLNLHSLLVKSF